MEDIESLKPVMVHSSVASMQGVGDRDSDGMGAIASRRGSIPPTNVNCDKPYGLSPFAAIEEVDKVNENSMSSHPLTMSRANLVPQGVGLFNSNDPYQSRDLLINYGGGKISSSGQGGDTSRLEPVIMQSETKVLRDRLDNALKIEQDYEQYYDREVQHFLEQAVHTSRSRIVSDNDYASSSDAPNHV